MTNAKVIQLKQDKNKIDSTRLRQTTDLIIFHNFILKTCQIFLQTTSVLKRSRLICFVETNIVI